MNPITIRDMGLRVGNLLVCTAIITSFATHEPLRQNTIRAASWVFDAVVHGAHAFLPRESRLRQYLPIFDGICIAKDIILGNNPKRDPLIAKLDIPFHLMNILISTSEHQAPRADQKKTA